MFIGQQAIFLKNARDRKSRPGFFCYIKKTDYKSVKLKYLKTIIIKELNF